MDVRTCRRCRKLFQYHGNPNCPDCVHAIDQQFTAVKNYLYDRPGATMDEIVEETGADKANIVRWLREGRLLLAEQGPPLLECEICHVPIRAGRFCDACNVNLRRSLETTMRNMGPQPEREAPRRKPPQDKQSKGLRGQYGKKP